MEPLPSTLSPPLTLFDSRAPSPLLSLPPELRNKIYELVLCTLSPPKPTLTRVKQDLSTYTSFVPRLRCYKFNNNILLVNRQVFQEAYAILIKRHLFVRIVTYGVNLCHLLSAWDIPIVALGKEKIKSFGGVVMDYSIKIHGDDKTPKNHFMVLFKDFRQFCTSLSWLEPSPESFHHHVVLHNPFEGTSSSQFLGLHRQELLVQPFRECLDGITSFTIQGNISPNLARDVIQHVARDIPINPWLLLDTINDIRVIGDTLCNQGDFAMALKTWKKAAMQMNGLAGSPLWLRMKESTNIHFEDDVSEIVYHLNMNQATAFVFIMETLELQGNPGRAQEFWPLMMEAMSNTYNALDKLGTTWQPQAIHNGEKFYRLARAYHILRRNPGVAKDCIEIASHYLPWHQDVRMEKLRIDAWAANYGF
ncbi:hypothetical protein F5Y11DRAFT_363240 [Daldinia sp. FL1419]|nr:hypothetical protein F5Y11DRAFT_363240 [Daldinia sp. FL1419]